MKIAVGSGLALKGSVAATTNLVKLEVTAIDGNKATVTPAGAYTGVGGEIITLDGSMDASGNPYLPMGLDAWLPIVNGRTGPDWTSYIRTPFFGVTRSVAVEGLAGNFVNAIGTSEKKSDTVQKLLRKVRRYGSKADLIVMNDEDWLGMAKEIQSTNTYFTQTSTSAQRKANVGLTKITAGFSTNYIDNIYDDPYCPKGKFYILDKDVVELWAYTNTDELSDGVAGNQPGKPDAEEENNKGRVNDPYKLLIDDFISTQPGAATSDGMAVEVAFNLFGSYVVLDPSVCGVGIFSDADTDTLLGYK